jgi:hypothetical protein
MNWLTKKSAPIVKVKDKYFGNYPDSMKPVDESTYSKTLQMDIEIVHGYFGDLFIQNRFFEKAVLSHRQLVYKVGPEAIEQLAYTSYQYWSEDGESNVLNVWQRVIWQVLNVYALGFAFEQYSLRDNNPIGDTWNPIVKSINEYCPSQKIKIESSRRGICGANISLTLFHKLFPEYFDSTTSPLLSLAIADVFSHKPNRDNPIYVALRNAIRKQIISDYNLMPYFWSAFVYHLLSQSTEDILAYEQAQNPIMSHEQEDFSEIDKAISVKFVATENNKHPAAQYGSAIDNDFSEITKKMELVEKQQFDINVLVCFIGGFVQELLESKSVTINQTGAFLHRVDYKYYLVFPVAIARMVEHYNQVHQSVVLDTEKLTDLLVSNNVIRIAKAEIVREGRSKGEILLAELNKNDQGKFIPLTLKPENNPVIKITS